MNFGRYFSTSCVLLFPIVLYAIIAFCAFDRNVTYLTVHTMCTISYWLHFYTRFVLVHVIYYTCVFTLWIYRSSRQSNALGTRTCLHTTYIIFLRSDMYILYARVSLFWRTLSCTVIDWEVVANIIFSREPLPRYGYTNYTYYPPTFIYYIHARKSLYTYYYIEYNI